MIFFFLILSADVQFDSLIQQGIHYSYSEKYEEAEAIFRKAIEIKPEDPAPYLFLTSLYGLYMADFSTDSLEKKFFAYSDTTVLISERKISSCDTSALVHLWLAGGYGARAFYKVQHKDIFSGVQDVVKSIKEFHKAIEIDSSLFDAYIGVAGYDYFKHRLFSYIPWTEDSHWESEIKLACEQGKYLKIVALACYSSLLIEEERFAEASQVATQLVSKFPDSRTFRWIRVKSYCGMEKWELARDEYEKLLELTLVGQPENFYNIGSCRLGLAKAYLELGETQRCKAQCEEILNLPDNPKIKKVKQEAKEILTEIKL
ncbi:hypothetical protein KAW50_01255 [candidate division WOR-3 bacterium]|nr:hypothetical protein [candidate division WOR-3 bacterium]